MFSSGLTEIYKKISSIKDKTKQNEAYNYLENQLLNNPYIKHQFELVSSLREKRGKITTQEAFESFVKGLKEKHKKFLDENKDASQLTIWKENKKLFEYFNINPKEISINEVDAAIDIYSTSKGLNEGIIKNYVKRKLNESLKDMKKVLKEQFFSLKNKENVLSLDNQFKIINFLSESMIPAQQKLVKASLRSLQEERVKNYGGCVEKLYKLRLLSEKITEDYIDTDNEVGEFGGGKRSRETDLKHIKRIEISTPINWQRPEKIILNFRIPVFPIGVTRNAAMTSALKIKNKINKLERIFLNATVYQAKRINIFDPVGTIWDVMMREQVAPGQKTEARVTCYLSVPKEADGKVTWDQLKLQAYQMLKEFDKLLPKVMGEFTDVLTPMAQKDELKATKGMNKKDKLAYSNKQGRVDTDLLRRKIGSGDEDFESRADVFGDEKFGSAF